MTPTTPTTPSAARRERRPVTPAALDAAEPGERNLLRAALLARTLSDLLLANVQNTASLNLNAARALLAHSGIVEPDAIAERGEQWRWSWRSFEICATSADQILELTRGHVERTTAALLRGAEQVLDEIERAGETQAGATLAAFETLRAAQSDFWQAATRAHNELVALARGGVASVRADAEAAHGPH